ncbi:MAG TPA: hypothetical protein VFB61_07555, partial [Gemmatimonadales bacterium]|nr:hypothetical protein [Gemmatimonadales bacterium]
DRLSPRDRALLEAESGLRYPEPPSHAELLEARERAVRAVPDRADSWYQLGDEYHHWGTVLGYEDAWDRANAAFRRALELDSTFVGALVHLTERAAGRGDTAGLRHYGTLGLRADSLGGTSEYFRLIMALGLRDSLALEAFSAGFDRMKERTLRWVSFVWPSYGWPVEDARRALTVVRSHASTRPERFIGLLFAHDLAMNAGRIKEGLALTSELPKVSDDNPRGHLHARVTDGIYWDGDGRAAAEAADQLVRWADAPLARDSAQREQQYGDICMLEQWRLHQGNLKTTTAAITKLRPARQTHSGSEFAFRCALMLEAWSATLRKTPEASLVLSQLDSVLETGPPEWFSTQWANLLVSRLFEMQGDLPRAIGAIRRANVFALGHTGYLSTYLREQGRLHALIGDRDRATRAYQHYLALRTNPDAPLQPQVDEVRAELALLTGEKKD